MPHRQPQASTCIPLLTIAVVSLLLSPAAHAAICDKPEQLLRLAYPAGLETSDGVIVEGEYAQRIKPEDIACKAWPSNPALTLMGVPLLEAEPASEGEVRGDVEVVVVDSKTGEPIARRREKGMAYADAIQFTGVELDTARYDIKSKTRAFGLVTRQFGSSMANPYSERSLWLYTFSERHLDLVLDGLVVMQLNAEYDGNCTGTQTEITRTISMASSEHEGHRDIIVDELQTDSVVKPESDDCKSIELSKKTKQFTLQFAGERYQPAVDLGEDRVFSYIEIAK